MDTAQLSAIAAAASILLQAGIEVETLVKSLVSSLKGGMSDEEVQKICDSVMTDALRRKQLADQGAR